MSRLLTHWNSIPGKPGFKTVGGQSILGTGDLSMKTIGGQSIFGNGDIAMSGVPYTGATQSLDMGLYDVQATKFKFGSTGPQLDNSSGTIRARTNNGLADAPISASSLTATSLTGLTAGYMALIDSITLGWPGTSYGGFQAGSNGSFGFYAGPKFDQSGGTIRARTNNGLADAPISASTLTVSGSISHASAGLDLKAAYGWVTLYDGLNCTFGTRNSYGAVVFNGNRLGFESGSVGIADAYLGRSQANELAVYIDRQTVSNTLGNFKAANLTASGFVTSGFRSLSADPTTLDIAAGLSQLVKNTTSGEIRHWVNDGGVMKKSAALT